MTLPRIASLVPSLTETVYALGLGDRLVARTGFCCHPADRVGAVPKVGGTKDVNLARLERLAPTHLLVNLDENRRETVDAVLAWPEPPVLIATHPLDPADNPALVDQLAAPFGDLPGVAARAAALRAAFERELDATRPPERPIETVLYLIWRDPWMTVAADTYLSRMLARVGWRTVPAVVGGTTGAARYPVVSGAEPWLAAVDRVLLSSEPYRFGTEHVAEARRLCPNAAVSTIDGEMLSWYGVRAIAGLAYLRARVRECAAAPVAGRGRE